MFTKTTASLNFNSHDKLIVQIFPPSINMFKVGMQFSLENKDGEIRIICDYPDGAEL